MTLLRLARLERGLTIAEVADQVNCDAGNLSRIERGLKKPSLELAEKLSRFYASELSEIQILYPERFINQG
ncbi:helix-turn-helix domain-containing protein [Photorhabdus khanii]|uniref:XRE family transcriptional regulator n=1 Tax=Photorhabdus khanii subsp. guanajuatensis TaxID=2100166 RepID=A0A4R4IN12_9GAMM|nr:helix-turn-helix transcriptional regulator [Photorhabdus khanii]TDB41641.1 XRE family transcriptional regulator [Photorhabdus khanii subsp. guanajuatensis]